MEASLIIGVLPPAIGIESAFPREDQKGAGRWMVMPAIVEVAAPGWTVPAIPDDASGL